MDSKTRLRFSDGMENVGWIAIDDIRSVEFASQRVMYSGPLSCFEEDLRESSNTEQRAAGIHLSG
jgi:hypothetical protein